MDRSHHPRSAPVPRKSDDMTNLKSSRDSNATNGRLWPDKQKRDEYREEMYDLPRIPASNEGANEGEIVEEDIITR